MVAFRIIIPDKDIFVKKYKKYNVRFITITPTNGSIYKNVPHAAAISGGNCYHSAWGAIKSYYFEIPGLRTERHKT
jgi:hypothetical protein